GQLHDAVLDVLGVGRHWGAGFVVGPGGQQGVCVLEQAVEQVQLALLVVLDAVVAGLPEPAVANVDGPGSGPGAVAVDAEAVPGVVAADAVDDGPGPAGEVQPGVAIHVGVPDDLVVGEICVHAVVDQALYVGAVLEIGPAQRGGLVAGHLGADDRRSGGGRGVAQPDRPGVLLVVGRRARAVVPAGRVGVRVGRVAVEVAGRGELPHVPGLGGAGRGLPVPVAVAAVVDPGRGGDVLPGQQVGGGQAERVARIRGRLTAGITCLAAGVTCLAAGVTLPVVATARGQPEDGDAEHAAAGPDQEQPPPDGLGLDPAHAPT